MNILNNIKNSKFLVDFLSLLTSNISILGLGVISLIITTRILGPDGIGQYAILTNFTLLFGSLVELGIRQSTIYFAGKGTYSLSRILSANTIIWIFSSSLGLIIYYLISLTNKIEAPWFVVLTSAFIIPATIANSFIGGIMMGADKVKKSANFNTINAILKLGLIVLFVVLLKLFVLGAILALLIPTTTLIFRKYLYLEKYENIQLKLDFEFELIKKLISQGILYGLAVFLMTNQKKIPILVMAGRISEHDIGIYSTGYGFSALLYNVYTALAPVIFIRSSKAIDPMENSLKVQKLMRVVFMLLIILTFILYFALEFIIPLLFGNKFIESLPITRIMFIGIIFYNVFLILNMDMAGRGKPWIAIYALIPVTLLNFFSNYHFIGKFGIMGAALSTSLSLAIGSSIYLILYARHLKMSVLKIITPKKSDWDFIPKLLNRIDKY